MEGGNSMASRSPEFLIAKEIENEDGHKDAVETELLLAYSMEADLMLMLAEDDQDVEKIPLLYFYEGNA